MSLLTVTSDAGTATGTFTVMPRFGFNYDIDGGLPAAASTLGCQPLTTAKVFNSSIPSSYPGRTIPRTVTHPLAAIKVPLSTSAPYLTSSQLTQLGNVFRSMPVTGTPIVTINQEGEGNRFGYTPAQITGSHQAAYDMFTTTAPANALYAQDFQTYSAHSRTDITSYITPGLPLYLMDWYPTTTTTGPAASVQPMYDAIRQITPNAMVGVAECNYTTQITTGITWTGGTQAQWFADAWAWAQANDMTLFMPYFLTAHGVPWPPPADVITELSTIAKASGL